MSFDFFNQGLKKETGPQFTKEQNQFLQSKLPLLDKKGTQAIPISNALDFLKFSGLRSDRIQKILKACNVQSGKKTLTYDQMKKIFRGIALAQDNIEPSAININANIKTKMPVFYDEDSDEEPPHQNNQIQQQPPVSQLPSKSPQNVGVQRTAIQETKPQKDKLNVFQGVFPPSNAGSSKPSTQLQKSGFAQFPPMHPSSHFSHSQSQKPAQDNVQMINKIKQFETKWKKLKTEGNKIDGGQVKNICKKLSDRSILSRAWKLCCLTYAGSLTKGEFFVFLEIISNNKIPQQLSVEMKAIIQEIDHTNKADKLQAVSTSKTIPTAQQSLSFTQLASSQLFQNFTKIETKPKTQMKIPKEDDNSQKIFSKLTEAKKSVESNNSQMNQLRRGQQTMNNLMCEVQQYISTVDNRTNGWNSQIEELKQNQQLLNDRLNKVCQNMNVVIIKQHGIIEDLMNNFATQNNMNNQRVTMLQNYVIEIKQRLDFREQQLAQLIKQKNSQRAQQLGEKVENKVQVEQMASPQSSKQVQTHQEQLVTSAVVQNHPEQTNVEQKQKQQAQPQPQPFQNSSVKREEEEAEYVQRMKSKRSQVLQLIMYITPLTQEEMPALIQRISEYSQEELNMVYINCYQKLQARQQMQAQRAVQMRAREQDFSSSNFKGQATPSQDMFQ